MNDELSAELKKKYPYLEQIFDAIKSYKKTGKNLIHCKNCSDTIQVHENEQEGFLEANCTCGKSKYRMRWDSTKK